MSARFHSLLSLGKHACIINASKLGESLHRLLNNPDAEAVHDVRVACRRLGVALQIIEPLYLRRNLKPLAKKIKALMKALSAVRDTEVLSERARDVVKAATKTNRKAPPSIAGVSRLADLLDAQVELGRLAGAATASHSGFTHLPAQIQAAVQALGLDREKLHSFPLIRLPQFAGEILQGHLNQISAMGVNRTSSSEDLHTLRIKFKKLRYAAEFFAEGLPAQRIEPLTKLAQVYQKILGDLHDADVALDMFRAWHAVRHEKSAAEIASASEAQIAYETIQAGLGKLIAVSRNDQLLLRNKFFTLWTLRHQRELTKLVTEVSQPLVKSRSTISKRS